MTLRPRVSGPKHVNNPKASGLTSRSTAPSCSSETQGSRAVAQAVLVEIEREGCLADEVLDQHLNRSHLDSRDRALTVELVYGVLRRQGTLDWRLDHLMEKATRRLPVLVRAALRLGAYQLLYLNKIPPSAAVNESVNLVKSGSKALQGRWTGFVNGVLRALIRAPAPDWPDVEMDPVRSLAVRYSAPGWLASRWMNRFGLETAESLCLATLAIPPLTLRTNTLRINRDRLLTILSEAGYQVRPTSLSPVGVVVEKCGAIHELPGFREGFFYVEDEAGQLVAPILDPQPGERVLDACAAPGGKATHLAMLMQDTGELLAVDRGPRRLRLLKENCRRLGVSMIQSLDGDLREAASHPALTILRKRPFDRILIDAPCSGLGVLKRHPEGKWQKGADQLARHQAKQLQLLNQASALLRPGGTLVYSTCSTEIEENEQVIERFCRSHPEFYRESVESWLPPTGGALLTPHGDLSTLFTMQSMDAFFAARLRKVAG